MSSNLIARPQDESPTTAIKLLSALRSIRNIGFVYSLERYLPEEGIIKQIEAAAIQLNLFGYKEEAEVLNHVLSLRILPTESGGLGVDKNTRLDSAEEARVLDSVTEWLEFLNSGKRPGASHTLPLRNRESKLA